MDFVDILQKAIAGDENAILTILKIYEPLIKSNSKWRGKLDEDLEEYYYWRKQQGNNVNRQKRVMSSISAFYKFLRKKKLITESPVEFIERPKSGQPVTVQT